MQSTHIRLSVIIPCFNHGKFIMDAISSVEECQEKVYEIIIVNDGSTDPYTCEVMEQLKKKGYSVVEQENLGLSAARNSGIKLAKGEYILPLDSDNKIRQNYILKGIQILDNFPEVGVVYGDAEYFGEKSGLWKVPEFDLRMLLLGNYIDACAVFRKSVWVNCGYYDTEMPKIGYEDWNFWLDVAKNGWKFYHISEVLFDYRVRAGSMVSACNIPENQKLLIQYVTNKHSDILREEYKKLYTDFHLVYQELQKIRNHSFYKIYKFLSKIYSKKR
ncbi:glycosyltransferase family 2 protein [Scytonema tolypothrichoides VB-61278]|nr:glycosyltransferase family 2 protein [Scytonema tolypothrichoides VB-61278]